MIKIIDIAFKDLRRSLRSASALVFMFGVPLLVTGMFYLMFGRQARQGSFELPVIQVVIANLDEGGPKIQAGVKSLPAGLDAHTLGEVVVGVLQSEELENLIQVRQVDSAEAARQAVDDRFAQVALIIPPDFSRQFADLYGQAEVELYQDPTLTIGPAVARAVLKRFMDGMAGVKIAVNVAVDQSAAMDYALIGQVVGRYLDESRANQRDVSAAFLELRHPASDFAAASSQQATNPVLAIVTPIMGGMMIFYAYYTGASTAQSILREDQERTLARLFMTPTPQTAILAGKFLSVFLTVLVQVTVLLAAARILFSIHWGALGLLMPVAAGIILTASTFGIFINSFLRDPRQGGMLFGGVLAFTGMLGMIRIFAMNAPAAARLGDTVSLLVPQGWAVRGLLQVVDGRSPAEILPTIWVMVAWSAVFFTVGAWRFQRRFV